MSKTILKSIGALVITAVLVVSASALFLGAAGQEAGDQIISQSEMAPVPAETCSAEGVLADVAGDGNVEVAAAVQPGVCAYTCEPCFLDCPPYNGRPQRCISQCY